MFLSKLTGAYETEELAWGLETMDANEPTFFV